MLSLDEILNYVYGDGNYGIGDESLAGFWDFDNPPGSELIDLSGNENHGDIHGATWTNNVPHVGCNDPAATNYTSENASINCLYNEGPVWHVAEDGYNTYNDGSLEYPFASIQYAVNIAANGDTVRIAAGTFTENISMGKS